MRKPWFWKNRNGWYLEKDNKQVFLADNEEEAFDVWHAMAEAEKRFDDRDPTLAELYTKCFE